MGLFYESIKYGTDFSYFFLLPVTKVIEGLSSVLGRLLSMAKDLTGNFRLFDRYLLEIKSEIRSLERLIEYCILL